MPEIALLIIGGYAGYLVGRISGQRSAMLSRLTTTQRLRVENALVDHVSPWLLASFLGVNCVGFAGAILFLGLAGLSLAWIGFMVWFAALIPMCALLARHTTRIMREELQRMGLETEGLSVPPASHETGAD
jgi:hypothetical protein